MTRFLTGLLLLLAAHFGIGCGHAPTDSAAPVIEEHDEWADLDQSRKKKTENDAFTVEYVPQPDPIPFNELFSLRLAVTGAPGPVTIAALRVTMPSHGHGMNTRPEITARGGGEFLVAGMQFHMEGHWKIEVSPAAGGVTDTAVFDVVCCAQ